MTIVAFTKYSYEGSSSRYRFYNYRECFEQQNIKMHIKPLFSKNYFYAQNKIIKLFVVLSSFLKRFLSVCQLLILDKRYDLVLIEYELFPYLPAFFEYFLKKRGIKYIVDYDDAIFHKYNMSDNILIKRFLKNKIAKVMQNAEQVIVCNEYLASYAKKYNNHTFKLPTVVLLDKYKKKMDTFQKEKDDVFVIGWIGSKSTSMYLLEILPEIEKFVNAYSNVRFDLVGFDKNLLSNEELKRCHLNIIEWTEEKEIDNILNFDVGIMPLDDDPWSRGKCAFKLVQYMSCGKPVIASAVGMNCVLVQNGENGFLVQTKDEWFTAFERLYIDKKLCEKMGNHNLKKIELEYNHNVNCAQYSNLIYSIVHNENEVNRC